MKRIVYGILTVTWLVFGNLTFLVRETCGIAVISVEANIRKTDL